MTRAIILLLLLTGCGPRYEMARQCQREAGPRSYSPALFGPIGAVAMVASDEDRAWRERMAACMKVAERN